MVALSAVVILPLLLREIDLCGKLRLFQLEGELGDLSLLVPELPQHLDEHGLRSVALLDEARDTVHQITAVLRLTKVIGSV